jgi:hypothetical protein
MFKVLTSGYLIASGFPMVEQESYIGGDTVLLCPIFLPSLPTTHLDAPSACHAKIPRVIPMAENNRSN